MAAITRKHWRHSLALTKQFPRSAQKTRYAYFASKTIFAKVSFFGRFSHGREKNRLVAKTRANSASTNFLFWSDFPTHSGARIGRSVADASFLPTTTISLVNYAGKTSWNLALNSCTVQSFILHLESPVTVNQSALSLSTGLCCHCQHCCTATVDFCSLCRISSALNAEWRPPMGRRST